MITKIESNEAYHSSDAVSASALKTIHLKSVWHWLRDDFKGSDATNLGSALHSILLEPETFDKEFAYAPEGAKRNTKAGKLIWEEFEANNAGKVILKAPQKSVITSIQNRFNNPDEDIKNCLPYMKGKIELSHYLNYEGVPVRVRPDCLGEDFIMDIKTCSNSYGSVTPEWFAREINKRAYHIQGVFYCDMLGIDPDRFRFVVVETKAPYNIFLQKLNSDQIYRGGIDYHEALMDFKHYKEQGKVFKHKSNKLPDGAYEI